MKFGVITFPGSNCDQDLIRAMEELGGKVVNLWHKDTDLQGCDFVFLPGGFSYGDYLRSGAIARFSPIMTEVAKHAARGGFVMGICNGFQILTEARLLDGALIRNKSMNFSCKNVYIKVANRMTPLTKKVDNKPMKVPIAHAEGNFYCDQPTLDMIEDKGLVMFRYCDETGKETPESNPNGSLNHIAGITNVGRNVFGMMPHPERASSAILGNLDGRAILQGALS
jgi:phosphoribosylformylglycinamidine synthase subunit PurQ / glutaminase